MPQFGFKATIETDGDSFHINKKKSINRCHEIPQLIPAGRVYLDMLLSSILWTLGAVPTQTVISIYYRVVGSISVYSEPV